MKLLTKIFLLALACAVQMRAATYYVNLNNPAPAAPYTNWLSAATNIQDAIDTATNGDLVLVTNGIYKTGGRVALGSITNRVAVGKALTVQSLNGPTVTLIQGNPALGGSAVRCVSITNGAVLSGFTLTNGATMTGGDNYLDNSGGGLWAPNNSTAIVSNCVVVKNSSQIYGGGAYSANLYNCKLLNNSSANYGGGAANSALCGCLIVSNQAVYGGGDYGSASIINSTIIENLASSQGGGIYNASIISCIVYYNSASAISMTSNYTSVVGGSGNCCTAPLLVGASYGYIFTNDPAFVDYAHGDYHLSASSPCINSGYTASANTSVDLDGNPRVVDGFVDIGAYEYQAAVKILPFQYVQQYGLSLDGTIDTDGDGMNNWQEAMAGTNPTNAASLLKITSVTQTNSGNQVTWQSAFNKTYTLQRTTNLINPVYVNIHTNKSLNSPAPQTVLDKTATNGTPYFYRVVVYP